MNNSRSIRIAERDARPLKQRVGPTPVVIKAGNNLIPLERITRVDMSRIEQQIAVVHVDDATFTAHGFDAIEIIMLLKPSALEGLRGIKWRSGAWAFHNCIGHPVTQVLAWLGYKRAAVRFHDWTTPSPRDIITRS